jgi:hypothetical protein
VRVRAARAAVALAAGALLVFAGWGLDDGYWLLTTDDTEGGAFIYGPFVSPTALVAGLVGLGLFALAIRR